jgi:hypothetical protein
MQHLRALAKEIEEETAKVASTPHGRDIIKALRTNISKMLQSREGEKQRVIMEQQQVERDKKQRVIDDTPIITIP